MVLSKRKKIFKSKKKAMIKKRETIKTKTLKRSKKRILEKKKVLPRTTKPALAEELIGVVTHYFPHVRAGVIKIKKSSLSMGDSVHIKGHTTDFLQKITSIQIDHRPIDIASKGKEIGLLVKSRVRHNDKVYKLK